MEIQLAIHSWDLGSPGRNVTSDEKDELDEALQ
jgi:hypothetical protein